MDNNAKIMIDNINKRNKIKKSWIYQDKPFGDFQPSYSFSNENLDFYYPLFDMDNKDILTVTGSGDQVLMGILNNANNIDTFDSNLFAKYNLFFKMFAIKDLDYNEFYKLYSLNENINRQNIYEKINIEKEEIKSFFDEIFKNDMFTKLFIDFNANNLNLIKKRITYLNEDKFYELKDKIKLDKVNFQKVDIFDVPDKFNKKYSFINLSNIYDYCPKKEFFILLKKLIVNNLDNRGKIMLNYCWSTIDKYDMSAYIKPYLDIEEIKISDICLNDEKNEGTIMVYSKKNKGESL